MQFQITNVLDWAYNNGDQTNLLEDLATRAVVHFLAGVDVNEVLSSNRLEAAQTLRERNAAAMDPDERDVLELLVALDDLVRHPPRRQRSHIHVVAPGNHQHREVKLLHLRGQVHRVGRF